MDTAGLEPACLEEAEQPASRPAKFTRCATGMTTAADSVGHVPVLSKASAQQLTQHDTECAEGRARLGPLPQSGAGRLKKKKLPTIADPLRLCSQCGRPEPGQVRCSLGSKCFFGCTPLFSIISP